MGEVTQQDLRDAEEFLRGIFQYEPYVPIEEWVEKNLSFPRNMTLPGQEGSVRLHRFPFQRAVLRAFVSPKYSQIWLRWAAQNSKTTIAEFLQAWVIDQDPGPTMLAFADRNFAQRRSTKHIQPFILHNDVLRRHLSTRRSDFRTLAYTFDSCSFHFAWAGSASTLAGESCRYVFGDEQDKFRHMDKREAHPAWLLLNRLNAFLGISKAFYASTPNDDEAPSEMVREYGSQHACFLPCPHCGKPEKLKDLPILVEDKNQKQLERRLKKAGYFVVKWEHLTGWGKERHPDRAGRLAYVKCPFCEGRITDDDKMWMLQHEKFVPEDCDTSIFWSHLPGWYSPRVTYGEVVRKFYMAQGDPEALKDWTNSVAAETWTQRGFSISEVSLVDHCMEYDPDMIPFVPLCVTMFVDVQQDEFYYVIRAWREFEGSALVRYGILPRVGGEIGSDGGDDRSFEVLDPIREMTFQASDGELYGIDITGFDASYHAPDVYEYCRCRPNCFPFQGADNLRTPLHYSRPETYVTGGGQKRARKDSVFLITWSTKYFRDKFASKMAVDVESDAGWWLSVKDTICPVYRKQLMAVVKVFEKIKKTGRRIWLWKTVGKDEHLHDCEVGNLVLADVKQVRDMTRGDTDEGFVAADSGGSFVTMGRKPGDWMKK